MKELSDFNFKDLEKVKWAFIDFWASWCGPCMAISPMIDELEKEVPDIEFYKCNIDANQEIARKLEIMSIPAFFIFNNGVQVSKMVGGRPKEEIKKYIEGTLKLGGNNATT